MIKKLLAFYFICVSFGLHAMENNVDAKREFLQLVNPKSEYPVPTRPETPETIYKFPLDYETRSSISRDEYDYLPPEEQKNWIESSEKGKQENDNNMEKSTTFVRLKDKIKRTNDFYKAQWLEKMGLQ